MDNRAVLLDFKLLVDRAVDILDSLSSAERADAVNYALSRIKQKFPESCVQVKRDHCTSRVLAVTENQNELYESLWNQQRSTTTVADLNQNFEKIMCREDFMCVDDEKYQPLSIYKCPKDEEGCDPSLVISRYTDAWMTLETASSSRSGAPQPFRRSEGVLSEKLIISGPIHFKCDDKRFTFNSDKFCISFSRPDEDFNRKAFKRQFLAMLEHAVNHRKPFIRRFFNNFVLSGAIQGVRPQQIKIRISDAEDISYKNGISKISSNLAAPPCANEETNQSTTSSEDVNMTTGPPNSIVAARPKEKGEPKSARPTKDKQSYNCLLCLKTYRKRKSLIDHYKMHPGYCHDCGKPSGLTLEDVIEHNKKVHYKEFPFICDICGESYSRRQQFHAHVEAHQKKDMKNNACYSCGECGLEFQRKKLHRQHLDDTGHKPDGAICEVCGAGFTSKNALSQHVTRVHKKDNSFECHICKNRFSLKANLERHVQLHTEIKRTYVCDQCGSSYFTYPGLREHFSNAHTDVSESKCTLCGKTFSSVKSLQRHLPSHSEERPHSCCFCMQTFKWKTHLVRHKQVVHGNQPNPKKLKRFAKCEEELVPVDIPPLAKVSRKSNSKPKQSGAKIISSPTSTMKKQKQNKIQLETPNSFAFATENLLRQCNPQQQPQQQPPQQQQQQQQQPPTPHSAGPENNLLMNINNFNRGAETFHFDPNANYNSVQRMPLQPEQQIISTYQQGSPQHHHQQQQQAQHHQQQQQQHHQQQQQPQQHHQPTPQHHHQTQHIPHHTAQQAHIQPQQTHLQPPQAHIQAQQHHQQTQQSHQQAQPPHQQSHHHSPQQPQPPQQQQQQPQHQQYPCASLPNDWHNLNFNAPTTAISQALDPKENKFFQVIEVNSNDFMGLPMDVKQDSVINAELLNFQNMWPPSNQQLNFNNGNVEHHNYNNIGSILTNLELIGNNTSLDFNNFEMIGNEQHAINQQQMQHNPYIHQEIDPSAGNINHNVINYDYNSQNHTITDLSNTILREQDSKNQNYQYHQAQGSFDHSGAVYGQQPSEEAKPILPPLQEYMHQPMQQAADVNIVYYPVKNEM